MPVVKVQMAIAGDGAGTAILIYDRRQARVQETHIRKLPGSARRVMEKTPRAFFNATWEPGAGWLLTARASEQGW